MVQSSTCADGSRAGHAGPSCQHLTPLREAWPVSNELPLPDPPLQVNAVLLQLWRDTDAPSIGAACQDPAISRSSSAIPYPYSDSDALGWLERQEPARLARPSLSLAVIHVTSAEVLGAIGLESVQIAQGRACQAKGLRQRAANRVRLPAPLDARHGGSTSL